MNDYKKIKRKDIIPYQKTKTTSVIYTNSIPDDDSPVVESTIRTENLLINSNYQIWQRFSKLLTITHRERTSNVATLRTSKPHGFLNGDIVQIYSMSDGTYNDVTATVVYNDETNFDFANTGTDEALIAESGGLCIITSRVAMNCVDLDYIADRWYTLMNSTNLVATKGTEGLEITATDTNKFGIIQIVPYLELKEYLSKPLSLSIDIASDTTAKANLSLIAWDGTEDAPTKDIVSAWGADGVEPTLVANWDYIDSTEIDLTSDYTTVGIENLAIPSGTTNVAIFVWCDTITGTYKKFQFRRAQIVPSDVVLSYRETSYMNELTNCLRFYQKSYEMNTPPFAIVDEGKTVFPTSFGTDAGGYYGTITLVQMYKTPTVELISQSNPPTVDKWRLSVGSDYAHSADEITNNRFLVKNDEGFTVSVNTTSGHYVADAEI